MPGATFTDGNDYFNYQSGAGGTSEPIYGLDDINLPSKEPFSTLKLQLNGHDRFSARNATYFRTCQPFQAGFKVPSGTCNFSRIDNASMIFGAVSTGSTLSVYAINYNVLRIMSGMGGLAYSN